MLKCRNRFTLLFIFTVTTRVSSCETNQFNSASQKPPPNDSHTEIKSAFVAVPSHDDSKAPLIKGGEVARSPKVRNRSQSGDTSSDRQGSAPARATLQFAPQPLRSSTSAPVLATVAAKSTKVSERTAGSTGGRTGPRPADGEYFVFAVDVACRVWLCAVKLAQVKVTSTQYGQERLPR